VAPGFWDVPGAFSVVGEFARVGGAKVLDLEDQDKLAAVVIPEQAKTPLEEGRFCGNFFGVVGPCFCWEFWQKRVVGRGFLVVKLWWIAGESWEVDGQDSGSKNMPLFPGLFLRDSRFGNFVQPHPLYRVHCRMR
jgi:hypothetical protein